MVTCTRCAEGKSANTGPATCKTAGPAQSRYLQNGQGQQVDAAKVVAPAAVVANTPSITAANPNNRAFMSCSFRSCGGTSAEHTVSVGLQATLKVKQFNSS